MNTRKLLVPLATLLVAGGIAVGSGATFDSTTASTLAVTSGSLTQTNTKAGAAVIDITNIKPGDTIVGGLTLKNTGSLKQVFTLAESGATNTFTANVSGVNYLGLSIVDTTAAKTVYSGTVGGVPAAGVALGTFAAGESHTYSFTVTLDASAPNTQQGKAAGATYNWNGVQEPGVTTTQS